MQRDGIARRVFLLGSSQLALGLPRSATPFRILIVRRSNTGDLDDHGCIMGWLFVVPDFRFDDPEPIGVTLEPPWRNNQEFASQIPQGVYNGKVRIGGPLGWRIALDSVPARTLVEIHAGNSIADTSGCILVGQRPSHQRACEVLQSGDAMRELRRRFGRTVDRPIQVFVWDSPHPR